MTGPATLLQGAATDEDSPTTFALTGKKACWNTVFCCFRFSALRLTPDFFGVKWAARMPPFFCPLELLHCLVAAAKQMREAYKTAEMTSNKTAGSLSVAHWAIVPG